MNTHAEYRRHSYRPPEQPTTAQGVESVASELARHRDPSLQSGQPLREQTQKRVAWVRPTELGAYVGPMVGRGIDLQTELIRQARRKAVTSTSTMHPRGPEVSRTGSARQEGLGL